MYKYHWNLSPTITSLYCMRAVAHIKVKIFKKDVWFVEKDLMQRILIIREKLVWLVCLHMSILCLYLNTSTKILRNLKNLCRPSRYLKFLLIQPWRKYSEASIYSFFQKDKIFMSLVNKQITYSLSTQGQQPVELLFKSIKQTKFLFKNIQN